MEDDQELTAAAVLSVKLEPVAVSLPQARTTIVIVLDSASLQL